MEKLESLIVLNFNDSQKNWQPNFHLRDSGDPSRIFFPTRNVCSKRKYLAWKREISRWLKNTSAFISTTLESTVQEVRGNMLDTLQRSSILTTWWNRMRVAVAVPDFKFSECAPGNYSFQVAEQKLSRSRDKRAATMNPLMPRVSSARFAWRMGHKHVTRKLADKVVPRQWQRRGEGELTVCS